MYGTWPFTDESTLYTAGVGGVRRWNLEDGVHELVYRFEPGSPDHPRSLAEAEALLRVAPEGRLALLGAGQAKTLDLLTGEVRTLQVFGARVESVALDPSGRLAATGDVNGVVRVGRLTDEEPHLLMGHEGPVDQVEISPDGRWVASTGSEDNTLRLWPMPDLSKPPLHTLPRDQLIAKLKSLTNFRAVRDSEAPEGWKIEFDRFPGWKETPRWW